MGTPIWRAKRDQAQMQMKAALNSEKFASGFFEEKPRGETQHLIINKSKQLN